MKYKNIIKLRLPEIQLLAFVPTQFKLRKESRQISSFQIFLFLYLLTARNLVYVMEVYNLFFYKQSFGSIYIHSLEAEMRSYKHIINNGMIAK
jgi:hypothetical protein